MRWTERPALLTAERHEQERLRALDAYQILGTAPENPFERIVTLTARLFKAPIALISLVTDEYQWFKACLGLDIQQMDRSTSFCTHAIAADEVLVIPDATLDSRFVNHDLVTGPQQIRFYAGAPLRTSEGYNLGTLCILDTVVRSAFTSDECATLQDLADGVVSQFELRKILNERDQSEANVAAILNSALDAVVTIDSHGFITEWNVGAERLFDYLRSDALGRLINELIIRSKCEAIQGKIEEYLESSKDTPLRRQMEVVAYKRDGTPLPCELAVIPVVFQGRTMFTAYFRDLTEQRVAQAALINSNNLLASLVDGIPEALYIKDKELRYVMINAAGAAHIGLSIDRILGRTDENLWPSEAARLSTLRDQQVLMQGQMLKYDVEDILPSGQRRIFRSTKSVYRDSEGKVAGLIGLSIDITDQKANEALIQEQNRTLESRVSERTQQLEDAQHEVLIRLAHAAEYRDDALGEHIQRVARIAGQLAHALGLSEENVLLIEQAAPLHDVGKIGIPDGILLKPSRLDDEEMAIMRRHAQIGAGILADGRSPLVQLASEIALTHHERWDGTGYPNGLSGEDIPIAGRIVAVADVLDALMNQRPYKKAWSFEEALNELQSQSGKQFDPKIIAALLNVKLTGERHY